MPTDADIIWDRVSRMGEELSEIRSVVERIERMLKRKARKRSPIGFRSVSGGGIAQGPPDSDPTRHGTT